MCNRNMRKISFPLLFLSLLLLSGCSIPVTVILFNNSLQPITVAIKDYKLVVQASETKSFKGIENSNFTIQIGQDILRYEAPAISEASIIWKGWGPFSKRVIYAQLESDGKIWLVEPGMTFPLTHFKEQPEGFPLEPNT